MSDQTYFVRVRGKVSGPFDVATLQKLVRRGMLSRAHQISNDRAAWSQAGEFVDLFPERGSATAAAPEAEAEADALEPVAPSPVVAAPSGKFYYAQDGRTAGPVPLPVLASLARSGAIRPDDMVWSEGGENAQFAAQVPGLMGVFTSGRSAGAYRPTRGGDRAAPSRAMAPVAIEMTRGLSKMIGILAGCTLLLFLNLPIASVDGHVIWCWSSLGERGSGASGVLLFFVLFSGILAIVMGVTTRGLVRGWMFVGIAAMSLVLLLVFGLNQQEEAGGYLFSIAVPYFAAGLIGVSLFRNYVPESKIGTIFQAILGGTLAATVLIISIAGLINNGGDLSDLEVAGQWPGWLVVAMTLAVIGVIAGLAGGVLGIVGVKPRFSQGVNWTTIATSASSILLPCVAVFIIFCGLSNMVLQNEPAALIFLVLRIILIFLAFLALLSAGLAEVFVASCVSIQRY